MQYSCIAEEQGRDRRRRRVRHRQGAAHDRPRAERAGRASARSTTRVSKVADIDGVLTAYSFTEPYFMLGSVLCEYLGLKPRFNASVICGGASPAVMLKHAAEAIVAGQAETMLVCAGENRATGLTPRRRGRRAAGGGAPVLRAALRRLDPGLLRDDRASATCTSTARRASSWRRWRSTPARHALLHPNAHMKKPITLEDVLDAKPIADPLGMLDCCLISDAGGAFIVTSAERARD